jgi:TolA-binding protein
MSVGRRRSRASLVALLTGLACGAATHGAAAQSTATPAAASEKSQIQPFAERRIGHFERPTFKKKTEESEKNQRAWRVSLQIPQRLRAALAQKINARIARDVIEEKNLRKQAEDLLTKFIAESPPDAQSMPEALMRLGELQWEDARDQFLVDFNKWDKSPSDKRGPPPNPDYAKPRALFLRVLRHYKTFSDYDLALYVDGFLANEEGKFNQALDRFNKLLAWFPNSRFTPDAHMFRAEYQFTLDEPNYQIALTEYEQVLKSKDPALQDLALFKSAWCLWRLGRSDEAAHRFLQVFQKTYEAGQQAPTARTKELGDLQREALKNLVAVFAEDQNNTADDMYRFLVKAGGAKFAGKIVLALAGAFYDQANYERGVQAYKLLLKLEPTSPDDYKYALAIAQGHSTMEEWPKLEQDYRWIIQDYTVPPAEPGKPRPQGGPWTRVQTPDTLKQAADAIEKQVHDDAVGLHAKAQADKNSLAEFQGAAALYEIYLSRFSRRPRAYDMYFNLAEIDFYHVGNMSKAATNYLAAVRLNPKGARSRDALYNALAALEEARAAEFEAAKKAGKKPEETPTDKQLTEAMELYIKSYPNDPKVPELLFRQGKLYYDYQVYDPAVRQWGLLLSKYPNSHFAEGAGELILDSFNKSKDYGNIETWARKLKSAPAFQGAAQQEKLDKLIVQAVFKQGEQLAAKGEHAKAAAAYLRAATEFPKEERAAKAAVNAEIEARRAADLPTLKEAAALLIKDHKSQSEAAQGVWIAADTYQSLGLYSDAASYDQTIVESWPHYEHHKDAAYNAVLLYTTVGDHDNAIRSGKEYMRYYSRDASAGEVTFLMGKADEKAGKWRDAAALYSRYSESARNPNSQIEALVRLATVRVKLKDERGASAALLRAMNVYKLHKGHLSDDGKYFAAKAHYMQGERVLAEYEAVKIEGDVKQLKTRLKKKSDLLKRAANTFLDTAKMGVAEWTTASLYQIGFTYESFSKALRSAPPPSGLNAKEKEAYAAQIDEFAVPIDENAIDAYEDGWKKAIQLGIFNSWTAKMRAALGRLNAAEYPPLEEIGFKLRYSGPMPLPALIDGLRRGTDGRSTPYYVPPPEAPKPDLTDETETSDNNKKDKTKKSDDNKEQDNPYATDTKKESAKTHKHHSYRRGRK